MHNRGWMLATLILLLLFGLTVSYGTYVHLENSVDASEDSGTDGSTIPTLDRFTDADPSPTMQATEFSGAGDDYPARVAVVYTQVHLRADSSIDAPVLFVLPLGQELVVTGPVQFGSGLTWYPVRNPRDPTRTCFVAAQFVRVMD